MSFFRTLGEVMRLPDLRRRILITLAILVIYRFAANVPVPGVDQVELAKVLDPETSTIGGFAQVLDLLSGGAVSRFSVLAMGVYPYITASIIINLLTPFVPALEDLMSQGQAGRDQINKITYYMAIPLALMQAWAQIKIFGSATTGGYGIIPGFGQDIVLTATILSVMTAGTMFAIWLGELITEDGIGNGLSIIIFAGIVARIPFRIPNLFSTDTASTIRNVLLFLFLTILTVVVIVIVQEGQRRLPVKYGKQVRGTKMYGGGTTVLPLRVNTAGMIPLIFAQSLLTFPAVLAGFFSNSPAIWLANFSANVSNIFGNQGGGSMTGQIVYWLIYFLMVVGFTYLYTDIMMKNQDAAGHLKDSGAAIMGLRPGKHTENYINKVVRHITIVGALFLGGVAVLPGVIQIIMNLIRPGSGTEMQGALFIVSGGGLIIVVGVVIDTFRQLDAEFKTRRRDVSFIR